ncbi:MAG: class I SAM-dependent methyltransferase [Hespellia sp.]|nr:class I SAM-dependent methyltransferase [Hespellia sp.]
MELSKRLQAVADLVTPGLTLADVGCDHGYIPIYLTEKGICPHVIAMDVNEGPLLRAKEHILQHQPPLPIELRLSDGLKALEMMAVQSVTIAGMGGGLIIKILKDSPQIVCDLEECILQPQSELYKVRAFLIQEGFSVMEEDMVLEDGKFYPMMKVTLPGKRQNEIWNDCELQYGKLLLKKRHPVLHTYLKKEKALKEQVLAAISEKEGAHIVKRRRELQAELKLISEALAYYE